MSDFRELVRSLNPVLGRLLVTGVVETLDSYARANTISGNPFWTKKKGKFGIGVNTTGNISVASGTEQFAASMTLLAFFDSFNGNTVGQRIISKRDGGGTAYDFYLSAANTLSVFNGTISTTIAPVASVHRARSLAVVLTNGSVGRFFVNGGYAAPGVNVANVVNYAGTVYLANLLGASQLKSGLQGAFVFGSVLTDEQISDLDEAFVRIPGIGKEQKIHAVSANLRPAGIECTEMFVGQIGSDGKIAGLKGVSVGTITQPVGTNKSKCCLNPAMVGNGGFVQVTNPGSLISATQGSIEFVATPRADCPNGAYLVDANANIRTRLQFYTTTQWQSTKGNPAVTVVSPVGSARVGRPAHLILTWWTDAGIQTEELFVDGVSQGTSVFLDTTACSALQFLSSAGVSFRGTVSFIRPYNQRITAAQARSLYVEASRAGMVQDERFGYPVSLANVTAGKVGPWTRGSGTWQWQDDGTQRKLVTIGSGYAWRDGFGDGSAFGAWYWKSKKVGAGNSLQVGIISNTNGAIGSTAQSSYDVRIASDESIIVFRVSPGPIYSGVIATIAGYVAIDTEYEFFITRRYDGLFTLYIRGGAFATWTTVGSGTDATHTTSNFVVADIDTGDTLSELMYIPMGGTLLPTDVPGLED